MGVQVRVGDKLNNNFYDQWSLRDLYFKKAMSLFIKKYEDFDLHFVFFVGKKILPVVGAYSNIIRMYATDRWWDVRVANIERSRMGCQASHRNSLK